MKINTDLWFSGGINFRVSHNKPNQATYWITEDESEALFIQAFSRQDLSKLIGSSNALSSEYVKAILDSNLPEHFQMTLIYCVVTRNGWKNFSEYINENFIGKRRFEKYQDLSKRIHIAYHNVETQIFYNAAIDDEMDRIKQLATDETYLSKAVRDFKSGLREDL